MHKSRENHMPLLSEEIERNYLMDLLLQASRWERSEGEPLSGLELEVQDRCRRLCGVNTVDDDGMAQSEIPTTYRNSHVGKVHITVNGKKRWYPREKVRKVPFSRSRTGYKWELIPEVENGQAV